MQTDRQVREKTERLVARIRREGNVPALIRAFRNLVTGYFQTNGRDLPWRHGITPYRIFISEIMLQQTQVERVKEKFREFTDRFHGFRELAAAPAHDVLAAWSGLGYNRRALMLHNAAKKVMEDYNGRLPRTPSELVTLPGIGPATAASISAFAFQYPAVFIETNIRSVFIHFFFFDRPDVHDEEILPLAEAALGRTDPFTWYSAVMDYGVWLKSTYPNPARRSRHYTRQSKFEGSDRQIRGGILKVLIGAGGKRMSTLVKETGADRGRLQDVLAKMVAEGMVTAARGVYRLPV